MMIAPVMILIFVAIMLFSVVGGSFSRVAGGGTSDYDEATLQAYADDRYAEYFSSHPDTYEDNILIVFLTNEECDGYDCIAWVGDNVSYSILEAFDVSGAFGQAVYDSVNETYYAYSLDSNLASVMHLMTEEVDSLGLESSFKKPAAAGIERPESGFYNLTELSLTDGTVREAVLEFSEETGIPTVIVVDTVENVYGKTVDSGDIFVVIISIALAGLAIFLIVRAIKKRANGDFDRDPGDGWDPPKM